MLKFYPEGPYVLRKLILILAITASTISTTALSRSQELTLGTYFYVDPSSQPFKRLFNPYYNVAAQQGYRIHIVPLPAMRSIAQAQKGITDGELLRTQGFSKNLSNSQPVPLPVCLMHHYVYALTDQTNSNYWSSHPNPKLIMLTQDQQHFQHLPEKLKQQQPLFLNDTQQAIRALAKNQGNLIYLPEDSIDLIRRVSPNTVPRILKLHPRLHSEPAYLFLHKRHQSLRRALIENLPHHPDYSPNSNCYLH